MTKSPKTAPFRTCESCGKDDGRTGPRPVGSALKLVGNQLAYACSAACTEALGWSLHTHPAYRRL